MSLSMPLMFHFLWSLQEVCRSRASIDPVLSIMRSFGMASFSSIDNHYSEFSLVSKMQEGCGNITNPPQNGSKLKYLKTFFVHDVTISYWINVKLCTEHGSDTAVLCAKFHIDLANQKVTLNFFFFNEIWVSDMHLYVYDKVLSLWLLYSIDNYYSRFLRQLSWRGHRLTMSESLRKLGLKCTNIIE